MSAMSIKSALRSYLLVSPVLHDEEPDPPFLWKAEALQRASEPGFYLSIACIQSEHLNARPEVSPEATEDSGLSQKG